MFSTSLSSKSEDEETGLPALGTWRSVYIFVAVVFILQVALLAALSRSFQ